LTGGKSLTWRSHGGAGAYSGGRAMADFTQKKPLKERAIGDELMALFVSQQDDSTDF
jgi:hypothetical protein